MPPKKPKKAKHLKIENGKFNLPNGDKYLGEIQANLKTKTIMRHGKCKVNNLF